MLIKSALRMSVRSSHDMYVRKHGLDLTPTHSTNIIAAKRNCNSRSALKVESSHPAFDVHFDFLSKQHSPPAENRKRRTAGGVTCPSITFSGGGGGEKRDGVCPILSWPEYHPPETGVPSPQKGHGTSGCKYYWMEMGLPPPLSVNRQMPVKTLPSRRITT